MRHPHFHLGSAEDLTNLRLRFRLDECDWCCYTSCLPLCSAVVRKQVWSGTSKLQDARITSRIGQDRPTVRHRPLHFRIHSITYGLRRFPITTRRRCHDGSIILEPRLPQAHSIVGFLRLLAMVGNHVSVASLCRGFGGGQRSRRHCVLLSQVDVLAPHTAWKDISMGLRLHRGWRLGQRLRLWVGIDGWRTSGQ